MPTGLHNFTQDVIVWLSEVIASVRRRLLGVELLPQDQLLISLIKGELTVDCLEALIKSQPDWHSVLDKAVQEGVFYPFYRNLLLSDAEDKLIPDELRERFRQTYYLHILKSTDFLYRIERVLNYIETLKIKILLFKGPAIDSFLYDDFLRPRLDLDIAVRDEEMPFLESALLELGYAAPKDEKDYPLPEYLNSRLFIPPLPKTTDSSPVGCSMNNSDGLIPVHIHKHLINNMFLSVDGVLSVDMKKVWEETQPFKGYHYICILKPELNIVYLCEHGLKHNFEQMVFLYEIEQLIRRYGGSLDWKKFLALVENFSLSRVVYYGLYFAKRILSADIPEKVIEGLKPKRFTAAEKIFIKNTLDKKHRRYSSYSVYLAMRKGLLKKARFIFRTLFPPQFTLKGYLIRIRRLILA